MNDGDGNPCRFITTHNSGGPARRSPGRIFNTADRDKLRAVLPL